MKNQFARILVGIANTSPGQEKNATTEMMQDVLHHVKKWLIGVV